MNSLTFEEKETIINWSQKDKDASIYTCDEALIRKLNKLVKKDMRFRLEEQDEWSKTYACPKKAIHVFLAPAPSEERRQELKIRALRNLRKTS